MAQCPVEERLILLRDGRLPQDEREALRRHAETCDSCRSHFGHLFGSGANALNTSTPKQDAYSDGATTDLVGDGRGDQATLAPTLPPPSTVSDVSPQKGSISTHGLMPQSPNAGPGTNRPGRDDGNTTATGLDDSGSLETMAPKGAGENPFEGDRGADYELMEEIGRGGMGIVYKARQRQLNRLVAFKMIRGGVDYDSGQQLRFQIEAEAVARLRHPNIVQVYDIGLYNGLPFVSLELLEGGTLTERLAGTPQVSRSAAQTVATLATAMEAAHEAGIIHRDLKPSNILFSQSGIPKIVDFGLAKRREIEEGHTASGVVVGTPSYMAPEQARGENHEIGPATDIYALGAILYEMLTGHPPFKGPTSMETVRQVIDQEPVPPSRLQPGVARDLETVCLKCLQKDPLKRYATAEKLAEDLQRFLNGEPIEARRTGRWERTVKWVRRRPFEAAFGLTSVLALLTIALLSAKWYSDRNLDRQRRLSEDSFLAAQSAVRKLFVTSDKGLETEAALQPLRKEILTIAREYNERVSQLWGDDPGHQFDLAEAIAEIAGTSYKIDLASPGIESSYRRAIEVLGRLVALRPTRREYRSRLADYHHELGIYYNAVGSLDQAIDSYNAGLRLRDGLFRTATSTDSLRAGYGTELARSYGYLGDVFLRRGDLPKASEAYQKSHEIRTELAKAHPNDPSLLFQLARSHGNLGSLHRTKGDLKEGIASQWRAAVIQQRLLDGSRANIKAEGPSPEEFREDLAFAHRTIGRFEFELGEYEKAIGAYAQSAELYRTLVKDRPGRFSYSLGLVSVHVGLAEALQEAHRDREARDSCAKAEALLKELTKSGGEAVAKIPDYIQVSARNETILGKLSLMEDQPVQAEVSVERARSTLKDFLAKNPNDHEFRSELGRTLEVLGLILERLKRMPEARDALSEAILAQAEALGSAPHMSIYQDRLKSSKVAYKRITDALPSSERSGR